MALFKKKELSELDMLKIAREAKIIGDVFDHLVRDIESFTFINSSNTIGHTTYYKRNLNVSINDEYGLYFDGSFVNLNKTQQAFLEQKIKEIKENDYKLLLTK